MGDPSNLGTLSNRCQTPWHFHPLPFPVRCEAAAHPETNQRITGVSRDAALHLKHHYPPFETFWSKRQLNSCHGGPQQSARSPPLQHPAEKSIGTQVTYSKKYLPKESATKRYNKHLPSIRLDPFSHMWGPNIKCNESHPTHQKCRLSSDCLPWP